MTPRILTLACLALILLGQLGRIDERFDAVNFALLCLVALGLAGVLAGLRRRPWPALLLGATIVMVSASLLAEDWRVAAGAACGGPVLRLVQYNAFKDNPDPGAAARWLALARPDVIVLEEGKRLAPLLAPLYPWRQGCAPGCSTMILSRVAPVAGGGAARGDAENRGALSAAWMRLRARDGDFTVVGVHLGRPWPFARFPDERRQLRALVAGEDPGSTIVAGDFNLPGWTFQMRRLETALGLTRLTRARMSWPARIGGMRWPLPLLGIDHVLAGPEWRATRVETGPALGSDHRPVIIELERCAVRR